MSENFLDAFVTIATFRSPALTARKHTCGSLRLRLHKPHVAILTATRFTFVVFCCDHPLHTGCCSGGMESWVEIVCSGDGTRTSRTHEWTCVGAANDLTNWASQTDCIYLHHKVMLPTAAIIRYTWDPRLGNIRRWIEVIYWLVHSIIKSFLSTQVSFYLIFFVGLFIQFFLICQLL